MVATVVLLVGVMFVWSYAVFQPRVETLPTTIPFSQQAWMRFVPDTAEFVSYVNYHGAYDATGNYNLFGTEPAVEIYNPSFRIVPTSIEYEVVITLPEENPNEAVPTLTLLKADQAELGRLEIALANSTKLRVTTHGDHAVFSVLFRRPELQVPLVTGNVAIVYGHILFGVGPRSIIPLTRVLDTADHKLRDLFSEERTRTAFYASGGSGNDYLALMVATFPTQIEGAKIAVKTVRTVSETVTSQIAFSFNSEDEARTQYANVKKLYTGGRDYWILGPFVVASFDYDMTELFDQVRGL